VQDRRSRRIAFIAHCLLNQNAKVAGMAGWPALVNPVIEVLSQANVGIVQLPCPETEHFGLDRLTGDDTKERYDCPEYRAFCSRLSQQIVRQVKQYLDAGYQVVCILGVEGSPSCSVSTVPTRDGPVAGSGVFFEVLLAELRRAGIGVPVIGVPEAKDLAEPIARIRQLLR
jgi:predicted secreted protein